MDTDSLFFDKRPGGIVFYTRSRRQGKYSPAKPEGLTEESFMKKNEKVYLYSAQSINRISPFFAKVSCMASAAEMQCGVCPLEDIFT